MHIHPCRDKNDKEGGTEDKVISFSRKNRDRTNSARYSQSSISVGGGHYEPLQVNPVEHHSYSNHTYGDASAHGGAQEREYASLDVSKMQNAEYAVPVTKETSDYQYSNSMLDPEYVRLEGTASMEKAKPQESKMTARAFDQGAAANANPTGYANTGFASVDNSHKETSDGKKKQQDPKKAWKGNANPPPTKTKPKTDKKHSAGEPAGAKVSIATKPAHALDSTTSSSADKVSTAGKTMLNSPTSVGGRWEQHVGPAPPQSATMTPPTAAVQDNKPATMGRKPILPKHVTEATAPSSSGHKGKPLAASAPRAAKSVSVKDGESSSKGKVSVAELAKRLEKGK